jgi:gliding motility-associated-like protein
VNAKPAQPVQINGPANIQANNSYTYSVTAIPGATSYTWTLPNGWSGTSTTNSITINSNTTTTGTLKVKANADSCSSAEQTLIINTLPVKPDLSDNTNLSGDSILYCQGATATQLQAKTNPVNNGGTIKWYTQATGGSALATAPTPSTTLAGTMTYYVSQTVNNIESERTAIRVIVKPTLSQPTTIQGATAVQANTSQTFSVTLVPGATSYTWTLPNGWTGTSTTNSITINTNTTTSGIVSVTANVNGCSSTAQTLTVGNLPTKPDLSDNTNLSGDSIVYCQGATATQLQAKTNPANNGGTIKWYTQATGGSALASAPTPSTTLAGTTTYYVSQTVNNIESERTAIRVIVKPTLSQPTAIQGATAVQANTSQTYSVTAVPGATSYTWSLPNGWTGTSTTNSITINTNTTTSGIVSVTANVNGCSSTAQTLTVGSLPTKPDLSDNTNLSGDSIVYCQGATATQLQAKTNPSNNGGTIKWYTQATGGTALTTAPTPNTTFSSLTTYYVSQTVNGIESERTPIRVIVRPTPSQPNSIQGNTTVVASTSNTYSVNAVSGATGYTWTLPGGWSGTSTTNSIVVTSGTTGGTIRVVAHVGPCSSAEQTLLVNIQGGGPNIDDNKNIVGNTIKYCVGAKADPLVAKATVANAILVWYTQPIGGSPSVMAPTPNTTSVDTQRYYVSQIANGQESLRTQIVVIVTDQNCPIPCMNNLVPDIAPLFITNICPDTTADLTSIETKNQPNGSVLRWFTSLPASEQTRVLNPSQVKTGTYYAVFYNPTDSCYSLNGDTATKVQVITSSCTNCNAGHVAPKLSTIGLSNICPSTTADLTLVTASNQPKGTTLEWHTSVPVSSATKVANPKSVTVGIYYAVFFDATNNCYSKSGTLTTPLVVSITSCPNPCQAGPIAPKVSQEVLTNICPSTTANLTTITASNTPSGTVLQWHTGVPATSFNKVTNPSAVLGGTYYAVFFDATHNCYSGNGFGMYAVDVVITNCPNTCQAGTTKPSLSVNSLDNACPKTTVDLTSVTASNRPAGTVLQWYTEMPATASNRVTTPSAVGAGTYYAIFYDTLNKCYTTQGYGSTPILVNITNCPNPCNSGNFAPEIIGSDVITNTCPSTTVNLNQFQVLNQPAGTTLVWHSKLPASSLNRIANPATYNVSGKVYGLYFDSKNNCYSQGGQFGLEIQVILTSCPDTCRSGKETPKTSGSDELTNICPSLTTNLTNVIITNKPTSGSVVVQWHTALPATALNRIKTPSSVNSGVYYAVFYDTLQKCYSLLGQDGMQVNVTNTTCPKCLSPNQAPSFGLDSIGTDCPSTTANLNTISVNNKPKGVVVRWYTSPQILSSNVVSNPSAVGAGMYYATFYDTANNCFANNGAGLFTPIKVSLTVCCNSGYQAPKLSAKELTNLCPDSMADLTRISATNQPTGVVLEWHTKTPAQSSTKVSNPYAVGPGIYYGVFYDVVNDCYTDGGIYTTPISVTRKACTTCNAGEAAPLLNTEGISNACPSTTADLTKITASNRPVGIVMEWHTSSTVTATSRVNNPSAVGAGTYYAIFYDPTNTCYAGNGQATTKIIVTISNCSSPCNAGTTAPALSQKTVTNVCPSTTANLSNISANNRPAGTNLQWHTALPATTSNRVVNPNAVSIGTYYALFYDPTNNCYSGNGYGAQQVEVVIRNCNSTNPCDTMQTSPVLKSDTAINTCPSLTVNLSTLENPSINGYVITWHKGTPATDANRLDSPQFAKAGTYYASYYDTARTCYSLLGKATKQVTVTTFNCPLCYAGSEAPRLSVSTLNNNCPTATADLTQITSFNLPKNTQLTWHTSVPANATNRIANPSAVSNAGTYYAVFFDATNNCYSGNGSAAASVTVTLLDCNNLCAAGTESPKLNISNGTLKNICPAVFANLTSVTASNKPTAGQVVLQWHTALPANATNRVILPSSVTSGTYYAIFYDTINKCYAGNGNQATQVVVSIENCTNTCIAGSQQPAFNTDILRNSCPNLTADLTLLVSKNQPKGTVIEWRMESGQVVANPKSVTSGRYVALFKDTVNNCYSTGTLNPLTVIQISCKEQVANNDYTQINNKKPGITVIDLSKNDTLTTGSKYSITPNGNPKRGTATIDPITGKLSYTITDTSFVGYDTITYQLCDTITNKCSTAYVIIALSNPKDTTVSNIDGKPEVIIPLDSVKGIPTKPVDAKGSYVIDTNPTNGTATIDSNGKLVYRPNAGACGKDSVKVSRIYSFSDGRPNEVYSYWVYIENPPCGPIAKNDYEQISNKKPGATVIDVSNNDIEPLSGSKYSIAPNGNPKRGTATIDPKTGKLSYTITDTSFVGYDTITYQLCDTITNKCSTAYVIIALSNPKDTTVSNIDGKPEVIIPLDSVTGIPIKPVDAKGSYVIDTNPTNGTATIDSNGKLVYRPNPGACGKDSVKVSRIYSFSDGRPNEVYSYWVYIENPPCDDEIPNYISPNGDGANDKFVLPASMRKKYPNLRLSIYNRWGNMVWRSNGVYQNNWGGEHYDASNLPDGVYYYIIELENQNEKARTGFIQVMRH